MFENRAILTKTHRAPAMSFSAVAHVVLIVAALFHSIEQHVKFRFVPIVYAAGPVGLRLPTATAQPAVLQVPERRIYHEAPYPSLATTSIPLSAPNEPEVPTLVLDQPVIIPVPQPRAQLPSNEPKLPEPPAAPDDAASGNGDSGAPGEVRDSPPVSHVSPPALIAKVPPAYPEIARIARVQGMVLITGVVTEDGRVANLTVVSGHPLLIPAALDCVKQWRYEPALLNGRPVTAPVEIRVQFQLKFQ